MSADFSKLLKHLADGLETHADRDGLTGVQRAVFISRGGHAPGTLCPSETPTERGAPVWCVTCERMHGPMDWGDGCMGIDETEGAAHHQNMREIAGVWEVARPLRDTSWWHRWRSEWACRKATGHCWHPEGLVDWWCCMCSGETDGMPSQQCVYCATGSGNIR